MTQKIALNLEARLRTLCENTENELVFSGDSNKMESHFVQVLFLGNGLECQLTYNPVCGSDGVTYHSWCEARSNEKAAVYGECIESNDLYYRDLRRLCNY